MVNLNLSGVPIEFPFQPYDVQEKFMESVLQCLQQGVNGLLESPTGTGKTLCLLCSTLGWLATKKAQFQLSAQMANNEMGAELKNQLNNWQEQQLSKLWGEMRPGGDGAVPKIIYASRTHSQLSQVVSELKRSSYRYMKVSILGSRDQLCIHPEVSKEQNNAVKLHMCHAKTSSRSCFYHTNLDAKKEDPDFKMDVLDIEDLVVLGKKHSVCPYFMTKEIRKTADIVFMPYNYLLDPKIRKIHNIELQGNVVVFDEAHNVEKMCEESASIELKSLDITLCIDEVTQVLKKFRSSENDPDAIDFQYSDTPKDFDKDDLFVLKALFLALEKAIDDIKISKPEGDTLPGEFMLQLLEKADLTPSKKEIILELLDHVIQYLTVSSTSPYQRKGNGLQKFADLVKIVFSKTNFNTEHMERVKKSYKVHIKVEQQKSKKGDSWSVPKVGAKASRVLSYWCFSPGFGMKDLVEEGVRCVILTSGTLAPLNSFAAELQVPFPITLENPHIIGSNQVVVGVVTHGPDGIQLDSSYKNRSNTQYVQSLGRTIKSVAQVVPDGLLVFFPSYPVMKSCQEAWQLSGMWDSINQLKPIFVEPNSKEGFVAVMTGYYNAVASPDRKGACFMAVCRGKVSEGLDFCDGNGRAVIITGLPYPPSRDPRVLEKQKYLEDNRKNAKGLLGLTGQQWYRLEATRAVNQAIGRVIRHKLDYGAILLCDQRFSSPDLVKQLSAWVRPRLVTFPKIGPLLKDLGTFYRNADIMFPGTNRPTRATVVVDDREDSKRLLATVDSYSHALSSGASRSVSNQRMNANPGPRSENVHLDISGYSSALKSYKTDATTSIFDPSQNTKLMIDFNEVASSPKLTPNLNSENSAPTTADQPAFKKRKITIISDSAKAKLDRKRMKAVEQDSIVAPSTSVASSSNPIQTPTVVIHGNKRESAAEYLKLTKCSLSSSSYAAFSEMTKVYRRDKNYEVLINNLKTIFLEPQTLRPLFRGFRQFLTREHTGLFDEECKRLQIS